MINQIKNLPKENNLINIQDDVELEWWAEYFNINKDKIKDAVNRVGASLQAVRRFLQK
jgi:predicted DNA-binding protein YlxM (UPF0122 family)